MVTTAAVGAAVGSAVGGSIGGAVGGSAVGGGVGGAGGGASSAAAGGGGGAGGSATPSGNPMMLVFLVQGLFMTSRLSNVPASYSDVFGGFSMFNLEVVPVCVYTHNVRVISFFIAPSAIFSRELLDDHLLHPSFVRRWRHLPGRKVSSWAQEGDFEVKT